VGVEAAVDQQSLLGLLVQAGRHAQDAADAVLATHGMRYDLWAVLDLLKARGTCAMAEISDDVVIPPPSLTRAVDKLIADGLVHRLSDPADRRRVLVRATRRGERLHDELARAIESATTDLMADVGQQAGLAQSLRAVCGAARAFG
jgi:DNA-binding MarR family transcriptional regulator